MKYLIILILCTVLVGCTGLQFNDMSTGTLKKYQQATVDTKNITGKVKNKQNEINFSSNIKVGKKLADLEDTYTASDDQLMAFKKINESTYQTVDFKDETWIFKTWLIDIKTLEVTMIDETIYSDNTMNNGYDLGQYWHELWSKNEANYHPYLNLTLTDEILQKAQEGKLVGVEYPIGTDINKIKDARPKPMEQGFYAGGPYVFYPEDTYFYDEQTDKVTTVAYKGDRLKITLDEVEKILGSPSKKGFDEMHGENYFQYDVGQFSLIFLAENSSSYLREVFLTKDSWY